MWQNAREILKRHKWQEIIYETKKMQESALSLEMSITHGNLEAGKQAYSRILKQAGVATESQQRAEGRQDRKLRRVKL